MERNKKKIIMNLYGDFHQNVVGVDKILGYPNFGFSTNNFMKYFEVYIKEN
jgi:hypothetical protein